jgi:RHS repeat-associated protein
MMMPNRQYSAGDYRYGFNGKEMDNEVKGDGNELDFGDRVYDPRLVRWSSLDPLQAKYPSLSPYNFAGNSPIVCMDPDGKVIRIYYDANDRNKYYEYVPGQKVTTDNTLVLKVIAAAEYNMKTEIGKKVWNQLSSSSAVVEIFPNSGATRSGDVPPPPNEFVPKLGEKTFDAKDRLGRIDWDVDANYEVYDGEGSVKGYWAPSTVLFHEMGHGKEADDALHSTDPNAIPKLYATGDDNHGRDDQYEHVSERTVSEKYEQVYISEINAWEQTNSKIPFLQPLRYNHSGRSKIGEINPEVNHTDDSDYRDWLKNYTETQDKAKSIRPFKEPTQTNKQPPKTKQKIDTTKTKVKG